MRFTVEQRSKGAVDEQLQAFVERVNKSQQFRRLAFNLTDICWQICIGTPGSSIDSSTQNCFVNCVDRFIDTSNFIAYRFKNIILTDPDQVDMQ